MAVEIEIDPFPPILVPSVYPTLTYVRGWRLRTLFLKSKWRCVESRTKGREEGWMSMWDSTWDCSTMTVNQMAITICHFWVTLTSQAIICCYNNRPNSTLFDRLQSWCSNHDFPSALTKQIITVCDGSAIRCNFTISNLGFLQSFILELHIEICSALQHYKIYETFPRIKKLWNWINFFEVWYAFSRASTVTKNRTTPKSD